MTATTPQADQPSQDSASPDMGKVREALEPFAKLADEIEFCMGPNGHPDNWSKACSWPDLVQARKAYRALSSLPAPQRQEPASAPAEGISEFFWGAVEEASKEWEMQAALPDDEPSGMTEIGRAFYLQGRLVACLRTILEIAPKAKLSASSAPPAGEPFTLWADGYRHGCADTADTAAIIERCAEIAEKRAAYHRDASLDLAFYSTDRMLRHAKANEAKYTAEAIRALKGRDAK